MHTKHTQMGFAEINLQKISGEIDRCLAVVTQ